MTHYMTFVVKCDRCGRVGQCARSYYAAIEVLKEKGWIIPNYDDYRTLSSRDKDKAVTRDDRCPRCAKAEESK